MYMNCCWLFKTDVKRGKDFNIENSYVNWACEWVSWGEWRILRDLHQHSSFDIQIRNGERAFLNKICITKQVISSEFFEQFKETFENSIKFLGLFCFIFIDKILKLCPLWQPRVCFSSVLLQYQILKNHSWKIIKFL